MVTKQIIFHIGYHKTATSWLQSLLFTPDHGYRQLATHPEIFKHIVQPHGLHFDASAMRGLITARMADVQPGEVPVVSSEILSGHPFQGGHESDVFAQRIKQIAPEAKILISIRNQMKILPSVYMQYVLRGGTMPYDRFFEGTNEPGYFGFTPRHFEYDLLVAHYQSLFGPENVVVLTQESLQADMAAASAELAERLGNTRFDGLSAAAQKVYAPSYPEYATGVLRRVNHVQASTLNPTPVLKLGTTPQGLFRLAGFCVKRPPIAPLFKGRKPVSAHVQRRFAGYYADSNARLGKMLAQTVDLSTYDGILPG